MINAGSPRNGILATLVNLWESFAPKQRQASPTVSLKRANEVLNGTWQKYADARDSSARQADRIAALERHIERATACVTPGANATVRKMAAILRGDA